MTNSSIYTSISLTWLISVEFMLVLLMSSTSTYVEYTTIVDCCEGLTVHCEVSTPLHVPSCLQLLVAIGPNPNDGLMLLQNSSAVSLTSVIGHNIP